MSEDYDRKQRFVREPRRRRLGRWFGLTVLLASQTLTGPSAGAETAFNCGGFAMLGGAQLACSHVAPKQPTQVCSYSWTLMTTANAVSTVTGSFLLPPGATNLTVYQGAGFASALSDPIVLCQGKRSR